MYRLLFTVTVMLALAGSAWSQTPTAADADFNGNGTVDIPDFLLFVDAYGTQRGQATYDAKFDLNGDDIIGIPDFLIFVDLYGQTVPAPVLGLTEIVPAEGMPGVLIELVGRFDANTTYQVKFDAVVLPVYAQSAERITAMVPVFESGSVPVRVIDAAGWESDPMSFEVLALPEPRMNAEQLQQTVADVGEGIGNVLAPLTEADVIYSDADAALLNEEMVKLNAAWGVLGERIAALPPEDAALLVNLLDNSGALEILEGLGKVDLSASKVVADFRFAEHHMLFRVDMISFLLGNTTALLDAVTVISAVAAVTGVGTAVAGLSTTASITCALIQITINSFVPTDLQRLEVEIDPPQVPVGGRSDVAFFGVFRPESGEAESALLELTLNEAIKELTEKYTRFGGLAEHVQAIGEYVLGIFVQVGMKGTESVVPNSLSNLASERRVPLDMSLYHIDLLELIPRLVPRLGLDPISFLLDKLPFRLTIFDPVKVEDDELAKYHNENNQLEGRKAGETKLEVQAFRFVEYIVKVDVPIIDGITVTSFWVPETVKIDLQLNVFDANFQGITYDNDEERFYVVTGYPNPVVYVYTVEYDDVTGSPKWSLNSEESFPLEELKPENENAQPLGITYANSKLWVVGVDSGKGKFFRYGMNQSYLDAFLAHNNNDVPFGITYAKNRFYVVDSKDKKVYVYGFKGDVWTHFTNLGFDLSSFNPAPTGITYANDRFYVVDSDNKRVYVYDSSGVVDSGFKLDGANSNPTGITYDNNFFYVADKSGKIYEYGHPDLSVESLLVSPDTLTTAGQKFTLRFVVRNEGIAQTEPTTLRYYYSTDETISQFYPEDKKVGEADINSLYEAETDTVSITLDGPSDPGVHHYGACVESVTYERYTSNNCSDAVRVVVSIDKDRNALEWLYKNTNPRSGNPTWTNALNWLSDEPLGAWYGVSTDAQAQGRVDSLILPNNNLRGRISPRLGDLDSLIVLDLRRNQLTGIIPDSLGNLTELTELYLSNNQLTGQIPSVLGDLDSLIVLDLRGNQLTGTIPESLGNLTELTELYLSNNRLTGAIPLTFGNLVNLEYLGLAGNTNLCLPDALLPWAKSRKLSDAQNLPNCVVNIPDSHLRALIAHELDKKSGEAITFAEMASFSYLNTDRWQINIRDLTGLEHATNLKGLYFNDNSISDLSPLSGLTSLSSLHFQNSSISDISPLSGLDLAILNLGGNRVSDISPLSGMTRIDGLNLHDNSISDISPLSGLDLAYLNLGGNRVSDISPLSGMTRLEDLHLHDNSISDISPLSGITGLHVLYLHSNLISDISPLSGMTIQDSLTLGDNSISDISPLSGVRRVNSLFSLDLHDNLISDISPLSGSLGRLNLSGNRISDISPLSGLSIRHSLNLSDNSVSDISPLSGLTGLARLNLSDNSVSDISPLSGLSRLHHLNLSDNSISDLSPLVNTGLGRWRGSYVDVRGNPLSATSINTHIPALQARGVTVYFGSSKPAAEEAEMPMPGAAMNMFEDEAGERDGSVSPRRVVDR